jgi:SAM-dependent methyltransferase
MVEKLLKLLGRPVWAKLKPKIVADVSRTLDLQHIQPLRQKIAELDAALQAAQAGFHARLADLPQGSGAAPHSSPRGHLYVPNAALSNVRSSGPFMPYSTCSTADFFHPRYLELCDLLRHPHRFHRKLWEWIFIIHHLQTAGVLAEGKRGVVFGVGLEKLPALFASLGAAITATDAPQEIGAASGWATTGQHSQSLAQLRCPDLIADALFDQRVDYRVCDMNHIDPGLTDYDFTWSSCCFEHLGSLEAGMQFVINSVEKTLKPGGIACHTTEYNLSSNDDTADSGDTVIYRKRDMEELAQRLRDRGHEVQPFIVAPDSHVLDFYVDMPPHDHSGPHLKVRLDQYVATSVGLVIKRGAAP